MGNRAVVVFTKGDEISPGVYVHNNGGPESVYAFLAELNRRKCGRGQHVMFVAARFAHVVGDFFDSDETSPYSLGVMDAPTAITARAMRDLASTADDNGVYVVNLDDHSKWVIRRFIGEPARELTKTQVEAERRAACKHWYITGKRDDGQKVESIHELFLRVRPKVSEHA